MSRPPPLISEEAKKGLHADIPSAAATFVGMQSL